MPAVDEIFPVFGMCFSFSGIEVCQKDQNGHCVRESLTWIKVQSGIKFACYDGVVKNSGLEKVVQKT